MLETRAARVVVVGALVALQVGLLVLFGTLGPAPALGRYPTATDLAADPAAHVGQAVVVEGVVVGTDPAVVRAVTGEGRVRVTVTGAPETSPGDYLRVFGTATAPDAVTARGSVAVPRRGRGYALGVSTLGLVWVLARLRSTWRLDRQCGLAPRECDDPGPGDRGA